MESTADHEWLDADGLGGFASGAVGLARSRRYHALLTRAVGSPSQRFVLVNGLDAFIATPAGRVALSAQRYQPGVTSPDGAERVATFTREPWPMWVFMLPDGRAVRQEIFSVRNRSATVITWTVEGHTDNTALEVRPFFSGRDLHALQHENGAFRFEPDQAGDLLLWQPYHGVPSIAVKTNGSYTHAPAWYRQFLYETERERGLDDTEDLAAPGVFTWDFRNGPAIFILVSPSSTGDESDLHEHDAATLAAKWRKLEQIRRSAYASPQHRSADDYIVRRGSGHTIIAGYPWFTDWGRDTFISLRGLCLATGQLETARSILLAWSSLVSEGMLPNFFPEGAAKPEYNSVDASLWFVVAVHDYLTATGRNVRRTDRDALATAVNAILTGYAAGTRYGIGADLDGLLRAGEPGVQLTWMDVKIGDWVVTPRIGKPVEVQALWINALYIGASFDGKWKPLADRARESFQRSFWNPASGGLYDVVDADGEPGRCDARIRPNQIFAVGGLPWPLLEGEHAASVVALVERTLLTPLGLRSLAPGELDYQPHYAGGVRERDGAYHQGTVWPWLMGPFVEAWLRVRGDTPFTRAEARERSLAPLRAHLDTAGLGHISEVADAEPPHRPGGCPFQAWSLGEFLRIEALLA